MGFSKFTMLILNDKTVKGCGLNDAGQLGLGHINSPLINFTNIDIDNVKQITGGEGYAIFLMNDGTAKGCGLNNYGQLGLGHNTSPQSTIVDIPIAGVKMVFCGRNHTMFLMENGEVKACGWNSDAQLGIGNKVSPQTSIVSVPVSDVASIACGSNSTHFILNDGTVKGCGANGSGQLGLGHTNSSLEILDIPITNVKSISGGALYTIFVLNDGTAKSCGLNNNGQLGLGNSTSPQPKISDISIDNVESVSCGQTHTMFKIKNGTVKGCGQNTKGSLGIGNIATTRSVVDIPIDNVKDIVCGYDFTLFLTNDNALKGCGDNVYGQLGNGNNTPSNSNILDIPIANVHSLINSSILDVIDPIAKFSLVKSDNKIYTILNNTWTEITDNLSDQAFIDQGITNLIDISPEKWSELKSPIELLTWCDSDVTEINIEYEYKEYIPPKAVITVPPYTLLDTLEDPKLLIYSENGIPTVEVTAAPKAQIVKPTDDIKLKMLEKVNNITLTSNKSENGEVRVIFSVDSGLTWKTYNSISSSFEEININNLESVKAKGMNTETFNAIGEKWNEVITESKIRFAYYLEIDNATDKAEVDKLSINMDLTGKWKKAIHVTDYDYEYDNEHIYVTFKVNGSYKVNYAE